MAFDTAPRSEVQTEHLRVFFPADEKETLAAFFGYAETVYADVDSLMAGALPARLDVHLVSEGRSGSSDSSLVLSILYAGQLEQAFARELARTALRHTLGPSFEDEAIRFFLEGLVGWVEAAYESKLGRVEPRWLWAAYAWTEEATELEYLQKYEEAGEELGMEVVAAAGYSLVAELISSHGWDALLGVVRSLAAESDICAALDEAGLGCASVLQSWDRRLELEAANYDFSEIPQVQADLIVEGEGESRHLSLWIQIVNPESQSYLYFVLYRAGESQVEEPYHADASEFEALIPLGEVLVGTKVLWDVAVWSEAVRLWRRSGWQDLIVD